eukprot:CAMPEP_0194338050 /NCGR_PEP_ID=MMETSP0171-20130528/78252_1 /TAXON_ID=218684 /ORGANISM="Corethron pennatum, Strain L29A3" /LENGTH=133 /DNA_ID=CAMNT_0039102043 /DNA_START=700 /DNA_END=1101 /DNA_ORIENTATION=-
MGLVGGGALGRDVLLFLFSGHLAGTDAGGGFPVGGDALYAVDYYLDYFLQSTSWTLSWRVVVYSDLEDGDTGGRGGLRARLLEGWSCWEDFGLFDGGIVCWCRCLVEHLGLAGANTGGRDGLLDMNVYRSTLL